MFDLRYYPGNKEIIPCGWQSIDEDKTYPLLSSRNPQVQQSPESESGDDYDMTNNRASETSDEDENSNSNEVSTTRMTEESSDEDELAQGPKLVCRAFSFYYTFPTITLLSYLHGYVISTCTDLLIPCCLLY